MSNCIEIYNATTTFTDAEINLYALLSDLETAHALRKLPGMPDDTHPLRGLRDYIRSEDMYEVVYHDRQKLDPKSIAIDFDRVSGSWREVNWLVAYVFSKYMKTNKAVYWAISDMGNPGFQRELVFFSPDSDKAGIVSWSNALKRSIAAQSQK
jgi:hypothetical protein